jgi:hypothetical protein
MKTLAARCFVALTFLAAAAVGLAGPFKSKVITSSALVITVPDDHFLKITNFSQEGGTDRGVVAVTLTGEDGGSANVLTATRIDLSTGANSQNAPEFANRVVIAGPATVTVQPVTGATLFITYRKESNESGGGGGVTPIPVFVSPTPGVTPSPGVTATPTGTAFPFPTP